MDQKKINGNMTETMKDRPPIHDLIEIAACIIIGAVIARILYEIAAASL